MRKLCDAVFHPLLFLVLAVAATIAFAAVASEFQPSTVTGEDGLRSGLGVIAAALWLAAAILHAHRKP